MKRGRSLGGADAELIMAAAKGWERPVAKLLEQGADPMARMVGAGVLGGSAIEEAAWQGRARCVELLAPASGLADPARGAAVLALAIKSGSIECVRLLATEQAVRHQDADSGMTALMAAAGAGMEQAVMELLPRSDPLAVDAYGRSALMHAAAEGHLACARALLPVSDAAARDEGGMDAEAVARFEGSARVADWIGGWRAAAQEAAALGAACGGPAERKRSPSI